MTVTLASTVRKCERDVADAAAAVLRWRRMSWSWLPFAGAGLRAAQARHKSAERALSRAVFATVMPAPKGAKINSKGFSGAPLP